MNKIKVIKQNAGGAEAPPAGKKKGKNERPKKKQSLESTVQDWITERRENDDAERRSSAAAWNSDIPAEAV